MMVYGNKNIIFVFEEKEKKCLSSVYLHFCTFPPISQILGVCKNQTLLKDGLIQWNLSQPNPRHLRHVSLHYNVYKTSHAETVIQLKHFYHCSTKIYVSVLQWLAKFIWV
jgi:hypothetical protein